MAHIFSQLISILLYLKIKSTCKLIHLIHL